MSGRLTRMLRQFVPGSVRAREGERWCAIDPLPSGTYNHELLRSRADGDFVAHPDYLWSPTPYWTARSGLNGHVRELADRRGGLVTSDVLIVLHPDDFARTEASLLSSWERCARAELAECFERLVVAQGFTRAFPDRPLQLKVVRDGDPFVGGFAGLQRGEFATALPPNLYLGPVASSAPLVEVFVADERGRFGSVGTLYSDQLAFNVGAHALDNGRVDRLGDSALYTLHRFPGEPGLHHKVHPDRADRVVVETGRAHGGETVRLVDRGREKVLLEVMLVAARDLDAELPDAAEPRGPRPTVGLPGFLPAGPEVGTILPEGLDLGSVGAFSIIPEALPHRIHTLRQGAFLLQRLHFRNEMRGYHVELDRSGDVAPSVPEPVARFEVVDDRISLCGVARDLAVDGAPLPPGERIALRGASHRIGWRGGELEFRPLRRPADPKWPYLARLDAPNRNTPLPDGEAWTIGRDAGCDVPLPDRDVRSNIRWRDGREDGPVVVQGGAVDRARFRTDAICVATKAARIDLSGPPTVENLSERCPLHIVRGSEVLRLKRGAVVPLLDGDELLIGNGAYTLGRPGQVDAPKPVEQLAPIKERHQEGPGTRGRRPRIGGTPGALIEPAATYRAALGINPADSTRPPVRSPRPEPARGTPRIEPVLPAAPRPVQLAPLAVVEVADDDEGAPLFDLPTHQLPSLSLDAPRDGFRTAGGEDARESAPTILDEDPDWAALLRAAGAGRPAGVDAGPPREAPPPAAPRAVPRGLQVDVAIPPDQRMRRFRGAPRLPGFGPLPPRPRAPSITPSCSGD
jgi:hypothetical protein